MSAAGRGGPREPEDFYTTPSWCVRRLLEAWRPTRHGPWVEPAAGNGAIIRTVDASPGNRPPEWRAFEIREEERSELVRLCGANARIENFLHVTDAPDPDVAVVLSNPPYTWAFEFLRQSKRPAATAPITRGCCGRQTGSGPKGGSVCCGRRRSRSVGLTAVTRSS